MWERQLHSWKRASRAHKKRKELSANTYATMTMRCPQRKRGAGAAWRLACALLISVHGAGFSREHRRALQASYTYANAADATPYCSLLDASICSGNPQRFLQVTANGPFEGIIVESYSTWLSFAAPALVDLDNDGDMDLVSGDDSGTLLYFENTGASTTPNFVPRTGTANPFDGFDVGSDSAPVFGDLDADGDMDIVVGEKDGKLNYFENTGTSTAPVFVQRTGSANLFDGFSIGEYSKPALGDLDNDGDLDLVVSDEDVNFIYYENTGTSTVPAFTLSSGAASPFDGIDLEGIDHDSTISFGDLDGDGSLKRSPVDKDAIVTTRLIARRRPGSRSRRRTWQAHLH